MAGRKRGRKKTVTDSAKKRQKREYDKGQHRIRLGTEVDRWTAAMEETSATSHAELARILLDAWYERKTSTQRQVEVSPGTVAATCIESSTPAVPGTSRTLITMPEVSDIEGSIASSHSWSVTMSGVEEMSTDHEDLKEPSLLTQYERRAAEAEGSFIRFSLTEMDVTDAAEDPSYIPSESDEEDEDVELDFDLSLEDDKETEHLEPLDVANEVLDFHHHHHNEAELDEAPEEVLPSLEDTDVVLEKKAICFESSILELANLRIPSNCQRKGCGECVTVKCRYIGTAMQLTWTCSKGHNINQWTSQPRIRRVFAGNCLVSATILTSGNNYQKIALFAQFLNLGMISHTTHQRIQRVFTAPVINKFYLDMMTEIHNKHRGKELVIAGDGRNDSPGHSAMYCTYSFIENESKDIISSVIVDKRMTQLKSTAMEKEGMVIALKQLDENNMTVKEVCTDAHPQITALLREKYPGVRHSYDTWHGAKNLGKKLTAVASEARNKELRPWISDIINHFWWCSRKANGDEMALSARWRGVLHHVTGNHEWSSGDDAGPAACEHGDLDPQANADKWLEPASEPHCALTRVVMDTRLLHSLKFYVNFRHTGELENFHEHLLMYASKRFAYTFPMYKARNQLAILDYQHHKDRNVAVTKDGQIKYARKYSKKNKNWSAVPVKESKKFSYMTDLLSTIVNTIGSHQGPIPKTFPLEEDDPRKIRPTIAEVSPQPTKVLAERKRSRFKDLE